MALHDLFRHPGSKRRPPPAIAAHSFPSVRGTPDETTEPSPGTRPDRPAVRPDSGRFDGLQKVDDGVEHDIHLRLLVATLLRTEDDRPHIVGG